MMISLLCVFRLHSSLWRNLLLLFCKPKSNPDFITFATASVLPVEREMQSRCERMDEDDLFLRTRSLQKDIGDNVGGRECQKENEKRTKVCWCVKADNVGSSVLTFSYLIADLSKCIGSLLGSVAVWLERNCTKIPPSIRSVLIRLAHPSSSSCIWISGRSGSRTWTRISARSIRSLSVCVGHRGSVFIESFSK